MFDDSDSDSDDDEEDIMPSYNDLNFGARRRDRSATLESTRRRLAQIERDFAPSVKETLGSKHDLPLDDSASSKNARTEYSQLCYSGITRNSKSLMVQSRARSSIC